MHWSTNTKFLTIYYFATIGSPDPDCVDYPHNIGLWVDALTFAVVTIQIIIFDTQYSEMMRAYLMERAENAG